MANVSAGSSLSHLVTFREIQRGKMFRFRDDARSDVRMKTISGYVYLHSGYTGTNADLEPGAEYIIVDYPVTLTN